MEVGNVRERGRVSTGRALSLSFVLAGHVRGLHDETSNPGNEITDGHIIVGDIFIVFCHIINHETLKVGKEFYIPADPSCP